MDSQTLSIIAKLRRLRQSQLAALAGVSRQAVSLWMKSQTIGLRSVNLKKLAEGLGLKVDELMRPLPIVHDQRHVETLQASLLWDRIYPSLADLVVALVRDEPRAIARLVQVYGLYAAAKIVGPVAWKNFHKYKNNIHPVRREQCEQIWKLHANPELI